MAEARFRAPDWGIRKLCGQEEEEAQFSKQSQEERESWKEPNGLQLQNKPQGDSPGSLGEIAPLLGGHLEECI